MSQLKTYDWPHSNDIIGVTDLKLGVTLSPGELVRHKQDNWATGIIIANNGNSVTVLWVKKPFVIFSGIFFREYTYDSGSVK